MALHLDKNQEATVWVGGLDLEVDEDLLWELMLQSGPVASVNMPRDKITGDHAGYAFVEFSSEQDADYAMKIMNMVRIYGKAIKINKAARDRKEMDVGSNIFVGNLEEEVDDQLLYNAFSVFGQVLAAKVMFDGDGKHRGFGFVNFADFDAADMAIQHMSGQFLCNRAIHVSYAYKEGQKGERHGSYEERYLAKRQAAKYAKPVNMLFGTTENIVNNLSMQGIIPQQENVPILNGMGLPSQQNILEQEHTSSLEGLNSLSTRMNNIPLVKSQQIQTPTSTLLIQQNMYPQPGTSSSLTQDKTETQFGYQQQNQQKQFPLAHYPPTKQIQQHIHAMQQYPNPSLQKFQPNISQIQEIVETNQ